MAREQGRELEDTVIVTELDATHGCVVQVARVRRGAVVGGDDAAVDTLFVEKRHCQTHRHDYFFTLSGQDMTYSGVGAPGLERNVSQRLAGRGVNNLHVKHDTDALLSFGDVGTDKLSGHV